MSCRDFTCQCQFFGFERIAMNLYKHCEGKVAMS